MTTILNYVLIVSIIAMGMWGLLSIADSAFHRQDIICQEGC